MEPPWPTRQLGLQECTQNHQALHHLVGKRARASLLGTMGHVAATALWTLERTSKSTAQVQVMSQSHEQVGLFVALGLH